jgi:hypothetical protein
VSRDQAQNIYHAESPKPGDYWHECYTPIARVLMVDDERVLVQKLSGKGGCEVLDDDPKPTIMTRRRFAKWLRYSTMPDKTWADVIPEHFKGYSAFSSASEPKG